MFEESLWQVGGPEYCGGCHAMGGRRCPTGAGYGGPLAGHPLHRGCFWLAAPPTLCGHGRGSAQPPSPSEHGGQGRAGFLCSRKSHICKTPGGFAGPDVRASRLAASGLTEPYLPGPRVGRPQGALPRPPSSVHPGLAQLCQPYLNVSLSTRGGRCGSVVPTVCVQRSCATCTETCGVFAILEMLPLCSTYEKPHPISLAAPLPLCMSCVSIYCSSPTGIQSRGSLVREASAACWSLLYPWPWLCVLSGCCAPRGCSGLLLLRWVGALPHLCLRLEGSKPWNHPCCVRGPAWHASV